MHTSNQQVKTLVVTAGLNARAETCMLGCLLLGMHAVQTCILRPDH